LATHKGRKGSRLSLSQLQRYHAKSEAETAKTLEAYLAKAVPSLKRHEEREQIVNALWEYIVALAPLIQNHENSIWAFIIRNSYRLTMLRQHFDVIVGNPP